MSERHCTNTGDALDERRPWRCNKSTDSQDQILKNIGQISKEKSQKYSHVLFSCFSSYILGDLRLFKGQFLLCKKTSGLGLLTQLSSEEDHDGNVPSLDPQKVYPTKSQEVG